MIIRKDLGETIQTTVDWYIEPSPGREVIFVLRYASGETFTSCESALMVGVRPADPI